MVNWAVVSSEIINVAAAIVFILFFSVYLYRIKRLSETRRFVHLYPYRRVVFVAIYIVITIVQVILFIIQPISESGVFNTVELYFLIGTCLNSLILIFQLFVLYVEIKKEAPANMIHRIYWLYLACISLMRLILQAYYEKGIDVTVSELVLSSLLFTDALVLFLYSWFMHKSEIQEFGEQTQRQFNILNDSTRSYRTGQIADKEAINTSQDGIFPYLNVELRLQNNINIMIKTYSNSVQVSRETKSIDQFICFYQQTAKLKLKACISLARGQINIVELQQFFSQLLSNWQYYESFVLEFLNIDEETKREINRSRSQQSGNSHISSFDPNRIYFDVRLPNIAKNVDHYEFDVIIWTNDHDCHRTVHKRYSEFEELDKRLRSLEFKGLRLKTPDLPQKMYFSQSDQDRLEERRRKLQVYIKRLMNDKVFVKTHLETRSILFDFFRLDCEQFALARQSPLLSSFSEFVYEKQMLTKQITEKGEPVTFYYFTAFRNGEKMGVIKKRFRMFDEFNQQFKRWVHNTQIQYKSIKLPTKIPHSSEGEKQKRHDDLTEYLNNLVKIPALQELYEAKRFLLVYEEPPKLHKRMTVEPGDMLRKSSGNSLLESSHMSRMSQLIDNLQFDQGTL